MKLPVLIKGAGDLASGVAHRLFRCGFPVVMTEIAQPTMIRCTVAFAEAVYAGCHQIEGVTSRLVHSAEEAKLVIEDKEIPVLIDPETKVVPQLKPAVLVDAIIAKRNTGTKITDAPIVIGLGPGFTAGIDVNAVVETKRGHHLGRVLLEGSAEPNSGVPGLIGGFARERLIKSPADGIFTPDLSIGTLVQPGDLIGRVNGRPVRAAIPGVLRGLLHGGLKVTKGFKIGDIDPRGRVDYCFTISDKARAIAGGVLEAILMLSDENIYPPGK